MIAVNKKSESLPVVEPVNGSVQIIDGTAGASSSEKLNEGIYRIAVESSVTDAGVHITVIDLGGDVATTANGIFMPHGSVEYWGISKDKYISVINGQINISRFA